MKEQEQDTLPVIPHWLKYYSILIMVLILGAVYYGFMSLSIERSYEVEVIDFSVDKTEIIIRSEKLNIKDKDEAFIGSFPGNRQPVNSILSLEQQGLYQLNTSGAWKPEKGEKATLYLKYKLYKTYLKDGI